MGNCCTAREAAPSGLSPVIVPYKKKGHRILCNYTEDVYDKVKNAVLAAETRKQAPVYILEIFKSLKPPHELNYAQLSHVLQDLYRDDSILADKEMNKYSLDVKHQSSIIHQTQFTLCSDRMEQNFQGYELDKICRVVPSQRAPKTNFKELKQLLLSNDTSKDNQFNLNDNFRFLDCNSDMKGDMVCFQSFTRCGNTFLRRYIE